MESQVTESEKTYLRWVFSEVLSQISEDLTLPRLMLRLLRADGYTKILKTDHPLLDRYQELLSEQDCR